jgi:hypothetical protein
MDVPVTYGGQAAAEGFDIQALLSLITAAQPGIPSIIPILQMRKLSHRS